MLTLIAETSSRFLDFAPYVPAMADGGSVLFQAALPGGHSGIFFGSGGPVSSIAESRADPNSPFAQARSHPATDHRGSVCFYAETRPGANSLMLVKNGAPQAIADRVGPLGPTMNGAGLIAFRATVQNATSAIFVAEGGRVSPIAHAGPRFTAFHGLPVISSAGVVTFRADLASGRKGIFAADAAGVRTIAETGDLFADLGMFPSPNDSGAVAFTATLRDGRSGVFLAAPGRPAEPVHIGAPFESFRGVLLTNSNATVFFATPQGGALGIFAGPDPARDFLLGVGTPLLGSTIAEFALNPVSINPAGQLALRITLSDQRQLIARVTPPGWPNGPRWSSTDHPASPPPR